MLPVCFLVVGLFFGTRTTPTSKPYTLLRSISKPSFQLLPTSLDRLGIQARDLRQQLISPRAHSLSLHRNIPATLLLIQSADQQVDPTMQGLLGMRRFLLTPRALTLVNI
jgi:hypothetical protein